MSSRAPASRIEPRGRDSPWPDCAASFCTIEARVARDAVDAAEHSNDRADDIVGIAPAYNAAPGFCFEYDELNRRTATKEVWSSNPSTPYTVASWSFDDSTSIADPPTGCGLTPLRTLGRLRAVQEPVFTRWFQYDPEGRVTMEIRVPTGATSCAASAHLLLGYTPNGNLASMRYGYGREVRYVYGTGALLDREASISVGIFLADGGVTQRTLIDSISWEPYGALKGYQMRFPLDGGSVASLEREVGAASTTPVADCPTSAMSETNDKTGRLRSIRVWDGATNIYRRTYAWKAEEVERISSCYLGGPGAVVEDYRRDAGTGFGYDGVEQLKGVNSPSFDNHGGPMRQTRYQHDVRGNVTDVRVTQWNHGYSFQYDGGGTGNSRKDWLTSIVSEGGGTGDRVDLTYDRDGRVTRLTGYTDSSGTPPALNLSYVQDGPSLVGPGSDTVMRTSARVSGASGTPTYTYWYDASNRRQAKVYPLNNVSDIFLYDEGHQLLEDRGNETVYAGGAYPIDEYIWLGGSPVAVYRGKLANADLKHVADDVGSCSRLGDGVACGVYFVVTDHIGKPVLALNGARKISGVGEYEPAGTVNRVQWWFSSSHPSTKGVEGANWLELWQKELGMDLSVRVHFPLIDTEQDCTGQWREGPSLWSGQWATMYEVLAGYAKGDVWSQWWPTTSDGAGKRSLWVGWGTEAGNCNPINCNVACPQPSGQGWSYAGFIMREYEYRRFQTGATPYFPPMRFPGQYYDAETGLNENWHRYYYPFGVRYLSSEPYLRETWWVSASAEQGRTTPTYAYGGNNPLRNTDPTGLFELAPGSSCGNWPFAVALAMEWAGCKKGMKSESPLNSCQTEVRRRAGCDICQFLAISSGPTAYIRPWGITGMRAHTNVASFYPPAAGHSEPNSTAFNSDLCTGDPETLAWVLIDEATHWCASVTGSAVPDCYSMTSSNGAGTAVAKFCMSMGGH